MKNLRLVLKKMLCLIIILLCIVMTFACSNVTATASDKEILILGKTTQYFTDEIIPDIDIKNILNAGINATSASVRKSFDEVVTILK